MHLQALWLVDSCVSIKARYPMSVCSGMVCAVCPGLQSVTLAGRILKLRDLKLREDGHLRVTNAFTTHTPSASSTAINGPSQMTPYRRLP